MTPTDADKSILIWRNDWLPYSETFIHNQVGALRSWQATTVGLYRARNSSNQPDVTLARPHRLGTLIEGHPPIVSSLAGIRLRQLPPNIPLHVHFGDNGVDALPYAIASRRPVLVTFHGQDVTRRPFGDSAASRRYRAQLSGLFTHATTLIAVSDFIASRLVSLGAPASKVVTQPIGIPLARHTFAQPSHDIFFAGRLVEKKGVFDLLAAASMAQRELGRLITIRIAGAGPLADALQKQAATERLHVEFLGRLKPADIRQLMASSRIFVGPSKTAADGDAEGLGMVFLEAAERAIPVVAYKHGGVSEAVLDGQTGLLAPEGDVRALANHIIRLLQNPTLASNMGIAARERVEREFDLVSRTRELETLYDTLSV